MAKVAFLLLLSPQTPSDESIQYAKIPYFHWVLHPFRGKFLNIDPPFLYENYFRDNNSLSIQEKVLHRKAHLVIEGMRK